MKEKIVFFQGTFDLLNAGHIRGIRLAKEQGDKLIIGLNTDELVKRDKGREPILPFEQRKEILLALRDVDEIIPCDDEMALPYLKALDADVFVLTREWEERHRDTAIAWMRPRIVVFSPRWSDIYCSSEIRQRIINNRGGL